MYILRHSLFHSGTFLACAFCPFGLKYGATDYIPHTSLTEIVAHARLHKNKKL